LSLILQQGTPFAIGEDIIGEDINDMDNIPIQLTGTITAEEVDNEDTLITDSEESGSGRMGALTEESEDEDDSIGLLWGLPPGLFNKTPPRAPIAPGLLNQAAELKHKWKPQELRKKKSKNQLS
jgi:hypothetical protein